MTNQTAVTLLKGLEQSLDDYCELNEEGKTAFRLAITALEQPERKTGRWIEVQDSDNSISGKCSECGWEAHMYEDDVFGMDYCPNCGARLLI